MFRLKVIVTPGDNRIAVGEEFDAVCDFFLNLPTQVSNNKDILLPRIFTFQWKITQSRSK